MANALRRNINAQKGSNQSIILRYKGEDGQSFFTSGPNNSELIIPKNRNVPELSPDQSPQPLTLSKNLLIWAFLGLAPAGLGTIILAPFAALSALFIAITHSLTRKDRKRVLVIWVISALLLAIAIPLSVVVFTHFNVKGRIP